MNHSFWIIDISDPEDLHELGVYQVPGSAINLAVDGNFAYVIEHFREVDEFHKLHIIDVSDPMNPACTSTLLINPANDVVVVENYVYVSAYPYLFAVNVTEPSRPVISGRYEIGSVSDMEVAGNNLFISQRSNGVLILDKIELSQQVGQIDIQGEAFSTSAQGDYVFIANGERGLSIVDISDMDNIEEVGNIDTPGHALSVNIVDNTAFISDDTTGLRIIDVTDPTEPNDISHIDTPGRAYKVVNHGNLAYIADGYAGLGAIDIGNLENPVEISYFNPPHYTRFYDIAVANDYAYAADGYTGLRVINIENLERPEDVGYFDTGNHGAESIGLYNDYVFLSAYWSGLWFFDVSDPTNPDVVGRYEEAYAEDFTFVDDYLYMVSNGLRIFNVTDPANIQEIANYANDTYMEGVCIKGDYAFVTDQYHLLILDISNIEDIGIVGSCRFEFEYPRKVDVGRDHAYVRYNSNHGTSRLCYMDISDLENPDTVGIHNSSSIEDMIITGNILYVADDYRIEAIDVSNPRQPEVVGYFNYLNTSGYSRAITLSDDGLLFVADHKVVSIFQFSPEAVNDNPHSDIPTKFHLSQAYPNPFNMSTRLSYALPVPSDVVLSVYNISGKLITTPISMQQSAGNYSFVWSAGDIPSGVYLAKLMSNSYTQTVKMTLIR